MYSSKKHFSKHGRKSKRGGGSNQMGGQMSYKKYLESVLQVKKKKHDELGGRIAKTFRVDKKNFNKNHPLWCGAAGNRGPGCRTIKKDAKRANIKVPTYDYYLKWFRNNKVHQKPLGKSDTFDYYLWTYDQAAKKTKHAAKKTKHAADMKTKQEAYTKLLAFKAEQEKAKIAKEKARIAKIIKDQENKDTERMRRAKTPWWVAAAKTKEINEAKKAENKARKAENKAREEQDKKAAEAKARQIQAKTREAIGLVSKRRENDVSKRTETDLEHLYKWHDKWIGYTQPVMKEADYLINYFSKYNKNNLKFDKFSEYKNNLKKLKKIKNSLNYLTQNNSYKSRSSKLNQLSNDPMLKNREKLNTVKKTHGLVKSVVDKTKTKLKGVNVMSDNNLNELRHKLQQQIINDNKLRINDSINKQKKAIQRYSFDTSNISARQALAKKDTNYQAILDSLYGKSRKTTSSNQIMVK